MDTPAILKELEAETNDKNYVHIRIKQRNKTKK
jgi:hypothetical protein